MVLVGLALRTSMAYGRLQLLSRNTDRRKLLEFHHSSYRAATDGCHAAIVWSGLPGAMECPMEKCADDRMPGLVHYQRAVAPGPSARFSRSMARAAGGSRLGGGGGGHAQAHA